MNNWDPGVLAPHGLKKSLKWQKLWKMEKVPHDDLEVVLNLMPFDSSSVVKLTFLYLNCWKKKTQPDF